MFPLASTARVSRRQYPLGIGGQTSRGPDRIDPYDCTGLVDLKGPNAAWVGLRHVEFGFVGREADAVWAVERRDYPSDGGAVGGRVVNAPRSIVLRRILL